MDFRAQFRTQVWLNPAAMSRGRALGAARVAILPGQATCCPSRSGFLYSNHHYRRAHHPISPHRRLSIAWESAHELTQTDYLGPDERANLAESLGLQDRHAEECAEKRPCRSENYGIGSMHSQA